MIYILFYFKVHFLLYLSETLEEANKMYSQYIKSVLNFKFTLKEHRFFFIIKSIISKKKKCYKKIVTLL